MKILLANPRGFCAGVDRAIEIVERALELYGAPIYVRHEVVHNRHVVEGLRARGSVFVDELDEVPDGATVIFSAHGVSRAVHEEGRRRGLRVFDATCPLVTKVHLEVSGHAAAGRECILIGHKGHPEVEGTMGQYDTSGGGAMYLVETPGDVRGLQVRHPENIAFVTQTTLSVDDTKGIIEALEKKFPNIHGPHKEDICYATTNRQESVKSVAPHCDMVLVVGAPNSSNSQRLVEVAKTAGSKQSMLVQRAAEIDWDAMAGVKTLGITAGASAPEVLVNEVVDAFRARYNVTVETIKTKDENVEFKLPRQLRREGEPGAPVRSTTAAE